MHTGDDTQATSTTPGPGRMRSQQTLPAFAVLVVIGITLWSAFAAWVWIS